MYHYLLRNFELWNSNELAAPDDSECQVEVFEVR